MKKALIGAGVLAIIGIAQAIHGHGVIVGHAAAMYFHTDKQGAKELNEYAQGNLTPSKYADVAFREMRSLESVSRIRKKSR